VSTKTWEQPCLYNFEQKAAFSIYQNITKQAWLLCLACKMQKIQEDGNKIVNHILLATKMPGGAGNSILAARCLSA